MIIWKMYLVSKCNPRPDHSSNMGIWFDFFLGEGRGPPVERLGVFYLERNLEIRVILLMATRNPATVTS